MRICLAIIIVAQLALSGIKESYTEISIKDVPISDYQNVGIRGNVLPLSWEQTLALKKNGDAYSTSLDIPISEKELEFKFVIYTDDNSPVRENIPNHGAN